MNSFVALLLLSLPAAAYFATVRARAREWCARRSTQDLLCTVGLWLLDVAIAASFVVGLAFVFL